MSSQGEHYQNSVELYDNQLVSKHSFGALVLLDMQIRMGRSEALFVLLSESIRSASLFSDAC